LFLPPRQVSIERNELLAQQLACTRAEAKLNIQAKKVALVAQVSDLLRKERLALRDYRGRADYDSADSECVEIKTNISYYKKKTLEAKGDLEDTPHSASGSPARLSSPPVKRPTTPAGSTGLPSSVTFSVHSASASATASSSAGVTEKRNSGLLHVELVDSFENEDCPVADSPLL
jgi:hypothetical protein